MTQGLERVNRFLDGAGRDARTIATPEGVPLEVEIATAGERLAAFFVDMTIWALATALLYLLIALAISRGTAAEIAITLILFLSFLLRNLYFIHFELARSSTPGKRIVGLRVIDRRGGPLTAGAIVARNLTREVETFLPLGLLFTLPFAENHWLSLSYLCWMLVVSALPLFNRDRLRAGDLIAGTMVIALPRRALLGDLAQAHKPQARFVFTARQLGVYGAFELQVLEEVLRRPPSKETQALQSDVSRKICAKIGWNAPLAPEEALDFLNAFYTAERGQLERERLFGKFREDKQSGAS